MINLAKRALQVFFRDKTAVFFSLLAVFIIIGLYAFFLGDAWVSSFGDMDGVRYLMDSWIAAGLLAITSVTTTMGAFGIMVDDKTKKITKDFISSPLKRSSIAGGYIISAFIIGVIMCVVTLILAEIYILANGGELMNGIVLVKVFGIILLAVLCNTAMVLFLVSFFNSSNAFATASTVLGTLIGFLTGIYLPVGQLPEGVRWLVKMFPASHAAVLFRKVMMDQPLSVTFAGAPASAVAEFEEMMGVTFRFGDMTLTPVISAGILILTAVIFYCLSIWNIARKKK
jgi:multidrug/hemolysin transport system permease protein